ncbi:MAG: DUF547 domain-containing protein [Planctomycetes bacterium]|nr:DUF547 domain-containing protein [Planctomycetota bacterium]
MAKCLVVFITSLMVLVFIAGCPPVESEPVEPVKTETLKLEPAETEPNKVEPDEVTPAPSEPNQIEPDKVEPVYIKPDEITPEKACPELVPKVRSRRVESVEPEPNDVEPGRVEPNDVEPNDLKIKPAVSFHDKCADILKTFVDDKGMVDYKTLRRKRLNLKSLLQEFDNLDPNEYRTWANEDKIAFWLNAYNIQMLKIITDNYPIRSSRILRLYPGWGPNSILHIKGIWTDYKFLVMDEEFTLSEIDKRFFRKEFDDPRIFFAISSTSLSSPPLRNEPYYGHKLNEQLDDQARRFLSSPLAFRTDKEKRRVYLSSLFQSSSYGREFISKFAIDKKFKDQEPAIRAVLNFITNYVSRDKVSFLEVGNYSVKFMKYDWTINDGS